MNIAPQLTALGHPQRLALFRLLMRRHPDRVSAGDLARALGLKPSTLSAYLSTLSQEGLISQARRGRSLLYGVDIGAVQQMFDGLFFGCCRGRVDICAPDAPDVVGKPSVLFVCVGNSARSIFAEAILRSDAGDRFDVYSAGTQPRSAPDPDAVALLAAKGHDVSALHAKHVSAFLGPDAPAMDYVITVCDRAADEDDHVWSGHPIHGHFSTPDPVAVADPGARGAAFQTAYGMLARRIAQFTTRIDAAQSRAERQTLIDDIALTGETA